MQLSSVPLVNGKSSVEQTRNMWEESHDIFNYKTDIDTGNNIISIKDLTFEDINKSSLDNLKEEYIDAIDDDKSALSEYTRTIKPLILQQAQEQKEQEQFDLAVVGSGLNPESDFDIFTFKLMQKGYSKDEATQRAEAYNSAGLIPNTKVDEKFGITVYDLSFIAHSPTYKKSLDDAFEKMDTKTLKGVVYTIESSDQFSIDVEDMKKIMPKDEDIGPKEVLKRMKAYWDNRYGTEQKIMGMFNNILKYHELNQKFSVDDLSYIKDGIKFLIDVFRKNLVNNNEIK